MKFTPHHSVCGCGEERGELGGVFLEKGHHVGVAIEGGKEGFGEYPLQLDGVEGAGVLSLGFEGVEGRVVVSRELVNVQRRLP